MADSGYRRLSFVLGREPVCASANLEGRNGGLRGRGGTVTDLAAFTAGALGEFA